MNISHCNPVEELLFYSRCLVGGATIQRSFAGTHSYHAVLRSKDGQYFATIYDDKANSLDIVASVVVAEASMRWPEGELASSYLTFAGRPFIKRRHALLTLRPYRGRAATKGRALAKIIPRCVSHCDALRRHVCFVRPDFRQNLRFAPFGISSKMITSRFHNTILPPLAASTAQVFRQALGSFRELQERTAKDDYVLCHGDLDLRNVILVGAGVQVVDHQCMHYDLPTVDLAHFWISCITPLYFAGAVDRIVAARALATIESTGSRFHSHMVALTALYVLLKKMALVEHRRNLFVRERVNLIADLFHLLLH